MRTGSKHDIKDERIDGGKAFDWAERARSRHGHGVLPRNMYSFGAKWTGTDISPEQIEQAKKLSQDMGIGYYAMPAEDKIAGMSRGSHAQIQPRLERCGRNNAPDRNTRLLQRKVRARAPRGVEAEGAFHARELERQDESLPRNRCVADTRGDRKLGARASPKAQRKRTRGVRCSPLRRHGGAQEKD